MATKTVKKKLHGGPVIEVSTDIIRWRKRLKKEGLIIGKNSARSERINRDARVERATGGDVRKRKFF